MTFSQLEIGGYFEFAQKSEFTRRLGLGAVGQKKTDFVYRMTGLNRVVGNQKVKVIQKTKEDFEGRSPSEAVAT